jgi:hypothetical protein
MNEYSNIRKLIALILDSFHAYNHIKIHENDKLLHASKKKPDSAARFLIIIVLVK